MNRNKHYKKMLKLSLYFIAIVFLIWFMILPFDPNQSSSSIWKLIYKRFSSTIAFISLFWIVYYDSLWKLKWKLFRRIFFDQPNLSGTWMGYLKSDFIKEGQLLPPIKIAFFIRQSNFFDIRITSMSLTNAFFSFGEILEFDSSNGMIRLLYQYSQKKTVPDSYDDQQGAADLFIYSDFLAGHYWTIVKTSGFIRVNKLSKELCQSFEEADKQFGNNPILNDCLQAVQGIKLPINSP
jgi:hypothetical protein